MNESFVLYTFLQFEEFQLNFSYSIHKIYFTKPYQRTFLLSHMSLLTLFTFLFQRNSVQTNNHSKCIVQTSSERPKCNKFYWGKSIYPKQLEQLSSSIDKLVPLSHSVRLNRLIRILLKSFFCVNTANEERHFI